MFQSNKYSLWYFNIIDVAKSRNLQTSIEKHHIIPKSLGGDNSPSNIANLTPREHFICHLLLTKFTTGKERIKMLYAFNRMHYGKNRYISNSKHYEKIREEAIQNLSLRNTGQKRSIKTCKKISKSRTGKGTGPQNKEHIEKRISKIIGQKRTNEIKARMSTERRGKTQSIDHIEKRQKSLIGKVRSNDSKEKYRLSKTGSLNPNAKSVQIKGKNYSTKHEACQDLNLTKRELNKLLTSL